MRPTTILSNEHRVIEVVIDCLERMTEQAVANGRLDRIAADQTIDFIRNFADGCHHAKEETHLFTKMVEKGVPEEGGPVGVMLYEHDLGRQFVHGMTEHIPSAASGDAEALNEFARHARGYAQLLRDHILKEDTILFPMADGLLSEEEQQQMLGTFEKVEEEEMGEGTHEKYFRIAESLADKFSVAKGNLAAVSASLGH
jgi:hemerythrin-like domain-containing protein